MDIPVLILDFSSRLFDLFLLVDRDFVDDEISICVDIPIPIFHGKMLFVSGFLSWSVCFVSVGR